jgi:hypothetical protein
MVLAPELALFAEAVAGQRHRHRGEEEAEVIRKRGKEISDQGGCAYESRDSKTRDLRGNQIALMGIPGLWDHLGPCAAKDCPSRMRKYSDW